MPVHMSLSSTLRLYGGGISAFLGKVRAESGLPPTSSSPSPLGVMNAVSVCITHG